MLLLIFHITFTATGISMSINTKLTKDNPIKIPESAKEGGLSFIREKFWLYFFIFLGIYILGRIISRGMRQELWTQGIRNMISVSLLFLLLVIGLINAHITYLMLILYIPFVDALPGRFGGQYTALNLFNLLSTIVIFCWFIDKVKKERPFFVRSQITKFAVMFIFFSFFSYVINGFEYGTFYLKTQIFNLKRWIDPVLLFFIASGMGYRRDLRRDTIIALLLGIAMVMFLAIKDVSQITHFYEYKRITGVGSQPNMLGAFAVDYMFLFLGILLVNFRKKIYWLSTIPFFWGIKTVAVTFSRGAYISFVITSLFISFIKNKVFFIICLAIFLFIATNLWILPQAVRERIEMTVAGEKIYGYEKELESSAARRIEAWKATFDMIRNKPLFGYGIGTVGSYLLLYRGISITDVHNSFLLLTAEYGLFTLLVFLFCLFTGIRASWFVYKHSKDDIIKGSALGFLAGIVGLIVNCFFGSHMTTLWEIGYFWVLLAIFANEEKELKNEMFLSQA
ncbi:MAG: O-antigen ligase family protein [Candidatus Omnitrophica bacterium]|nr:O-antigen ligase family protein [Candidatus Omnitrophota bacterium]